MTKYSDSLRGYGHEIHVRDNFTCRYCGADGKKNFETWITFSVDHLLPKGHPDRNDKNYIVSACQFCNVADNRYFDKAEKLGLKFDNMTPDELVKQRWPYIQKRRQEYRDFWEKEVKPLS